MAKSKVIVVCNCKLNLDINPDSLHNLYIVMHPFSDEASQVISERNNSNDERLYLDKITKFLENHPDACIVAQNTWYLEGLVKRIELDLKPVNLRYIVPTFGTHSIETGPIIGWPKFFRFVDEFKPERINICGQLSKYDGHIIFEKLKQHHKKIFLEEELCFKY